MVLPIKKINAILFLAALTLSSGCSDVPYMIAEGIYHAQPKKRLPTYAQATGTYTSHRNVLQKFQHYEDQRYYIALASSGGGYRATYVTLGVMLALSELNSVKANKNLLQDIDLFSSVSGSGLAVGYYLAKLYEDKNFDLNKNVNFALEQDQKTGKANILRTNLDKMLFTKDSQKIQQHLKLILNTKKGGLKIKDILPTKPKQGPAKFPLWFINATIFQNMDGITIDPISLYDLGIDWQRANNMNVSQAVMASMAYPMVIPPLKLASKSCPSKCYIYLIDGGIYDNLGALTAIKLASQSKSRQKIIIIVDASTANPSPYSRSNIPPKPLELVNSMENMVIATQSKRLQELMSIQPKNTILILLRLNQFKQNIGLTTRLNASLSEQKKLISIGKQLVYSNKYLQSLSGKKLWS